MKLPAAGTSRPALRALGPGVLAELARLFAVVGICLQCAPGSSTCPVHQSVFHSMLGKKKHRFLEAS